MAVSLDSLRQIEHHIPDSVRLYVNSETDDYPAHWHNSYEVIMPVENSYSVIVDSSAYEVAPGDVLIIPSGVVHELFAPPSGSRLLFLIDQEELLFIDGLPQMQYIFYPCVFFRAADGLPGYSDAYAYLSRAAEELRRQGDSFSGASARAWLSLFFTSCARILDASRLSGSNGQTPRTLAVMQEVCAYIVDHCDERLTLPGMASWCGYSKYHFTRLFRIYAGMGFHDFLTRQRIMRCRHLLMDPGLTVTEVALRSGFGSIATFNRVFREHEGLSPTDYREHRWERSGSGRAFADARAPQAEAMGK